VDELLSGGLRNSVRRVGDRVVRHGSGPREGAHHVLRLLEAANWRGAPRLLASGPPEELEYLPGLVPARGTVPAYATAAPAIVELGQLIRQLHDLTAQDAAERGQEVFCHNDLAPANTVFDERSQLPIAFIDWDQAAPGTRVADLGHAAWQWFSLGPAADLSDAGDGVARLVASYGTGLTPGEVFEAAVVWQLETADGIEAGASTDPALAALARDGVPASCREAAAWTTANTERLLAASAR